MSWSLWQIVELEDEIVGPPKAFPSCIRVFSQGTRDLAHQSAKCPSNTTITTKTLALG